MPGYHVKTALFGLLAVPIVVSLGTMFDSGLGDPGRLVVTILAGAGLSFGLLFLWGRRPDRPTRWLTAGLPVVAVPATLLAVWMVGYAVTGGLHSALGVVGYPGFAYSLLLLSASLGGYAWQVPVVLISVLLGSVAGFVVRGLRAPRATGARGLVALLTACALLVGVCGVQLAGYAANRALLSGADAAMEHELDLYHYSPFTPDNRLVVPDKPASLKIAGDHPRLDGATALYPVYGAIAQATYVPPSGPDELWDFVEDHVPCSTTPEAYNRLINGEVDAIFVAQPSKGQLARAAAAGVELDLHPIGREAFVFFVNADNPVTGLTLDQVRDIYSRRITNWSQVGGKDEEIIAFQRPEDSGSQTMMLAAVMKDRAIAQPLIEELSEGMGSVITEVARYRNLTGAIGYSFRWYATVMNPNPGIRLLAIDGIEPSVATIRDGSYPLTGDLQLVTAGSPNPQLPELVAWIGSDEGRALIEKAGYVVG